MIGYSQENRRVKNLSETLAKHLNRRNSGEALKDANYNLQYGQYDEFVSNVYAAAIRKKITLSFFDKSKLRQLVSLMKLQQEIEELRKYIIAHPEPPTDLRARRFG